MSKASLEDRLHEIAKHINRGDLNTILDAIETVRLVEDYKARIDELEGREITEEQITRAFINWHGSDLRPCPIRSAFEGGYRAALRGGER